MQQRYSITEEALRRELDETRAAHRHEVHTLRDSCASHKQQCADLQSRLDEMMRQRDEALSSALSLTNEVKRLHEQCGTFEHSRRVQRAKNEAASSQLGDLNSEIERLRTIISSQEENELRLLHEVASLKLSQTDADDERRFYSVVREVGASIEEAYSRRLQQVLAAEEEYYRRGEGILSLKQATIDELKSRLVEVKGNVSDIDESTLTIPPPPELFSELQRTVAELTDELSAKSTEAESARRDKLALRDALQSLETAWQRRTVEEESAHRPTAAPFTSGTGTIDVSKSTVWSLLYNGRTQR